MKLNNIPNYLYVEPANICNANCIFCPYIHDKRKKEIISNTLFFSAINEYKEIGGKKIGLTPPFGEVLIDPNFIDKVQYIKKIGFDKIHTYTNGTLIHKHGIKELLTSGLTDLYISVAPFIEEVYRKIYRINCYKQLVENIKNILIGFSDISDKTVKNLLICFRSDRPLEECKKTSDYLKYIAPYIVDGISISSFSTFDSWSGMIHEKDLLEGMHIKNSDFDKKFPCIRSFNLHVCVNGDVRICGCRHDLTAAEDELYLGNINKSTILQLYNSPKIEEMQKSFQMNKLYNICRKCSWYSV